MLRIRIALITFNGRLLLILLWFMMNESQTKSEIPNLKHTHAHTHADNPVVYLRAHHAFDVWFDSKPEIKFVVNLQIAVFSFFSFVVVRFSHLLFRMYSMIVEWMIGNTLCSINIYILIEKTNNSLNSILLLLSVCCCVVGAAVVIVPFFRHFFPTIHSLYNYSSTQYDYTMNE